jgi:hypothetical protein
MSISRREWLAASGAMAVSFSAWAAQESIAGEDLTQTVRRWNTRPPMPNFRPGNVRVTRQQKRVDRIPEGFKVRVSDADQRYRRRWWSMAVFTWAAGFQAANSIAWTEQQGR